MTQKNKRREADVMKLIVSEYQIELVDDRIDEFFVWFHGPKNSPYEGGVWRVHVELPEQYPYKSPSIGFEDKIYHPNIDPAGSVCLDVINQTWSPMFDLINVFEVFLPQLLLYPNPTDPLNGEAATLLMREPDIYKKKVKDYVRKYAQKQQEPTSQQDSSSDSNTTKGTTEDEQEQMDVQQDEPTLTLPAESPSNNTPSQLPNARGEEGHIQDMEVECMEEEEEDDDIDSSCEGSFLSDASDSDEADH
eukprot:TRINITY_DN32640_c0_g2_i3.p2 TRINITY_DN32640_c0_g2~~TRINITY_DN32640_c0_g2_i3.p2  ORF type:complete len:248 (-),score=49.75 TRINITY_DN32640_c0_g2_i3:1802-2545(-)